MKCTLFKKIISFGITSVVMCANLSYAASATTYQFTIDNDPTSSSGYTAYGNGFTYMSSSSCYNGDARYSIGDAAHEYYWKHIKLNTNVQSSLTTTLQVYLNHSYFSAYRVDYFVCMNGTTNYIGWINQNIAPGGWNYLSPTSYSYGSPSYVDGIMVMADGASIGYTGADAIKVKYNW